MKSAGEGSDDPKTITPLDYSSCLDPTKVRRLKCGNDAIENENSCSGNPITKWPSLAEPEPHKIPASNLAKTGEYE